MTETCPPAEQVAAFVDGALDDAAIRTLDEHVAACADCRNVIALLDGQRTHRGSATLVAVAPAEAHLLALAERATALGAGARLGAWRIERLLGAGGMGQVFEVVHEEDGRRAALKVLKPELASRREIHRRFVREQDASRRLEHPAFVGVLDAGIAADGTPFFVMDLVVGETLRQVVAREGPMPEARARAIGAALLDAMAAAHAAKVVHRDVKPDNVALEAGGRVRILDFGIARIADELEASTASGATATATGQMLGTPAYMPPEQARAMPAEIDERSDVFAIAATLVYLVSGKPPRPPAGTLFEAMTQPVPPVRTLASVSPAFAFVLDRALAFDKHDRWPSATAMREALLSTDAIAKRLVRRTWAKRAAAGIGVASALAAIAVVVAAPRTPPRILRDVEAHVRYVSAPAATSSPSVAPPSTAPLPAAKPPRIERAAGRPSVRKDPLERRQ